MNGQGNGQGNGQRNEPGYRQDDLFELDLRDWMAQGADAVRPAAAPYPEIVRQGRAERRRRLAVAGAALVALAVVPATTLAFTGNSGGGPADRVSVAGGGPGPSVTAPAPLAPAGPGAPATPGQLADGITLQDAAAGLEQCLAYDREHSSSSGFQRTDLGKATDYRILLAHRSTGNDNSPGDGHFVVAVRDNPPQTRLICTIKDGRVSGINTSRGDADPERGAVVPDMNGGKLHLQRLRSEGPWKLPYRWGSIGTVDSSVARVTVSYGSVSVEAALDHGWFAATSMLDRAVTEAPRIQGYDAQGKRIYDSNQDQAYDKPIP